MAAQAAGLPLGSLAMLPPLGLEIVALRALPSASRVLPLVG